MKNINEKLIRGGFKTVEYQIETDISRNLLTRYENLPIEYLTFLKSFKEITNKTDTTWFNLKREFDELTENEFKWNEFELMSLEWCDDDNDELKKIEEFWNQHVPIIMSTEDGFQFLAICLENEKYGEIVHGMEPEFENIKKICDNFNELLDKIEKRDLKIGK
ncbi:SMI1/KNR4 family protein [Tenacibaculum finnmarkense genomovar ulcerans]|uniref:SMI1/KNR4 family protein n=1 Tax=Tenacibaculum finnmarkense TaxID=2781243 RepID=UPI00187B6AED|nr:SMI1/KNR4 family protein [Tenacibaculum finnmarkense]MBE7646789.1 SMI1/KNR4 family protein [Tenacibaculum finnmarkense genomovar ulcerans]MCD8433642.1 SMI1/KNR4 family protein [Tenacibaculum finnmarkense genomovar ulcerans]MCG8750578.1 SMI1/KNR4 family protein [Tenacibaculum finnmarkense]MCG8804015.1 SMI1/KNR4 family protein [Tenacibaculum finnmarkense]MCG8826743.1 SMI1/KNR4 family protein [Tenacibaculum finnmarkense]